MLRRHACRYSGEARVRVRRKNQHLICGNLRLVFSGQYRSGRDQRAGRWRWADNFSPSNAGRIAGDRGRYKRCRVVACLSDRSLAHAP